MNISIIVSLSLRHCFSNADCFLSHLDHLRANASASLLGPRIYDFTTHYFPLRFNDVNGLHGVKLQLYPDPWALHLLIYVSVVIYWSDQVDFGSTDYGTAAHNEPIPYVYYILWFVGRRLLPPFHRQFSHGALLLFSELILCKRQ